jgi:glycosyltransferase involved in cell wall biosynthesis
LRIGFFARVESAGVLERVEFYRQDIEILRSLGHDVVTATRWRDVPRDADLYYVWWWTWALPVLALARTRRKPSIVTGVLDHPYPIPGRGYAARSLPERALMNLAMRAADVNVLLSRHEAEGAPRDLPIRNPRFIPLAVDTEAYSPGSAPREAFALTVLWMERYNVWRKCAVEIVEAIPAVVTKHPDARFVVAGEHHDGFDEVAGAARRLGVERHVEFPGAVSREEKIRLMRTCRVYLQPTRYEGFGAAILEAMSCGAPVVTNPVGAVPEVVGDCAVFLPDNRPGTIAGAVGDLWNDEDFRARLGTRGRSRAVGELSLARRRARLGKLLGEMAGPG